MKKGKNVKLAGYRAYKINYGTVDSRKLKSVYLNIQTWAEPKDYIESASRIINNLSRTIKHSILDVLDKNFFEEKFIVDLDIRSSGIHVGKKSFLCLECYFYLKDDDIDFKSKELKDNIKNISDFILMENFISNKNFSFTQSKKQFV